MSDRVTLIATAAFGLESVVARELQGLGYTEQTVENGRVLFEATVEAIPRCNLWLRAANRVQVLVGRFEARDFGELFDGTSALPWEQWIPRDGRFPVNGRSVKSQLSSVPACQRMVKKAIVERLKKTHTIDWFEEDGATYAVEVALHEDVVTLTLDTSGAGLHERGYRTDGGSAPLRETLAAGLILLSFWNRDRPFADPCCGSGTLVIEAAMIGRNMAPGRFRDFAAEEWSRIPTDAWVRAHEEANDAILPPFSEPLQGSDILAKAITRSTSHAELAGVATDVQFETLSLAKFRSHRKYGCLICNPPYGERIGAADDVARLHEELGRTARRLDTWSVYVFTGHEEFEQHFSRPADRRRKLYNGRLPCTLHQYLGPKPPWQ